VGREEEGECEGQPGLGSTVCLACQLTEYKSMESNGNGKGKKQKQKTKNTLLAL